MLVSARNESIIRRLASHRVIPQIIQTLSSVRVVFLLIISSHTWVFQESICDKYQSKSSSSCDKECLQFLPLKKVIYHIYHRYDTAFLWKLNAEYVHPVRPVTKLIYCLFPSYKEEDTLKLNAVVKSISFCWYIKFL